MAELAPMFLTNLCYTAQDFRRETEGVVCTEGVTDLAGLKVTSGGSGLNLFISAGSAYVQGDDDPDQGVYFVNNDAQVTLTATAADPTKPRIDTAVATVRDSDYGGADDDWVLQIVAGTPTVGATLTNLTGAAVLPDSSLLLGYVLVPATFTGPFVDATHILDARKRWVSCGEQAKIFHSRATRITNINISNSTPTDVTWPVLDGSAVPNPYFTGVAGGTFTILQDGVYDVQAFISWATNATGYRRVILRFSILSDVTTAHLAASGVDTEQSAVALSVPLLAGETVKAEVTQSSGGALAVQTGSFLSITRKGPLAP